MSYRIKTHRGREVDEWEVPGPTLIIGRGGSAQLRLDDETIDIEHARIERSDENYVLTDLGSAIDTYVNGIATQKKLLADSDRIAIGSYVLEVSLGAAGEALVLDVVAPPRTPADGVGSFDYAAAYALHRPYWNKTLLSLFAVCATAVLLLGPLRSGRPEIFQAGPVSSGHAVFASQCERCHQPWRGVAEVRCQECHGAQIHQSEQAGAPACTTCHVEHRGGVSLAAAADGRCVQCHADLRTKSGRPARVETRITDFAADHPEFTIPAKGDAVQGRVRMSERGARQSDPGTIKLNHLVHLRADLKGPKGAAQLACKDCHQPAADGTIMQPVRYAAHCQHCHALVYDPSRPDETVPHAAPGIVDAFLLKALTNQSSKVSEIERKLFNESCATCHELEQKGSTLPEIKAAAMPERWFAHARFSHRSHRVLECAACHTRGARSRRTDDVLIPGIQICQECHKKTENPWPAQNTGAPTACSTCHVYHERPAMTDWDGPLNLRRFLEGEAKQEAAAAPAANSYRRYFEALREAVIGSGQGS